MSLTDELAAASGVTNILPEGMRESAAWQSQGPVTKAAQAVGSTLSKPYRYLQGIEKSRSGIPISELKKASRAASMTSLLDETGLTAGGLGFGESIVNAPISIANAALEQMPYGEIPYLDLSAQKPEGLASDIGSIAGNMAGYGSAYGGATGKLSGYRPSGYAGLLSDLATGTGLGYLLGGEGGDLGRIVGGIAGGILEPLSSFGGKKIGERVSKRKQDLKNQFTARFNNIIEGATKAGGSLKGRVPNLPYDQVNLFAKGRFGKDSLTRFLQKPTLENGNRLQSDMGKQINSWLKKDAAGTLSSEEAIQLGRLMEMQAKVKNSLVRELERVNPGSGESYLKTLQEYGEKVIPYKNSSIAEFEQGKRTGSRLAQDITQKPRMEAGVLPYHPEAKLRKLLPWAGGTGLLGAGVYGAHTIMDYLFPSDKD